MHARAWNRHTGQIERLPNHRPIHGLGEELAELLAVHVLRSQNAFVRIRPGTCVVVVPRGHGDLSPAECRPGKNQHNASDHCASPHNCTNHKNPQKIRLNPTAFETPAVRLQVQDE
jgi:hypothetical protein